MNDLEVVALHAIYIEKNSRYCCLESLWIVEFFKNRIRHGIGYAQQIF